MSPLTFHLGNSWTKEHPTPAGAILQPTASAIFRAPKSCRMWFRPPDHPTSDRIRHFQSPKILSDVVSTTRPSDAGRRDSTSDRIRHFQSPKILSDVVSTTRPSDIRPHPPFSEP